eukprot:m.129140 g.129140  ORF g.129140 m.129140 type:complete len:367 (+) comp37961_c0_seq4:1202-2302(+)
MYFDTDAFHSQYGKLQVAEEVSQEDVGPEKKCQQDFALWKACKPGEPYWPGPGGNQGRPGWHIECSAMACSVFGPTLHLHTGGIDLRFPHHNNEIAQCEACHSLQQWCNYFLHTGHLHIGQEKMSKSLKNYITIKEFLNKYTANQFRIFCLLSNYRSGIEYTESRMNEAVSVEEKLSSFLSNCRSYVQGQLKGGIVDDSRLLEELATCQAGVQASLADDFDTPRAMRKLFSLVNQTNSQILSKSSDVAGRSPSAVAAVASFVQSQFELFGCDFLSGKVTEHVNAKVVDTLTDFRTQLRRLALATGKDDSQPVLREFNSVEGRELWRKAYRPVLVACDQLREQLKTESGIVIQDFSSGSSWKSETSQ